MEVVVLYKEHLVVRSLLHSNNRETNESAIYYQIGASQQELSALCLPISISYCMSVHALNIGVNTLSAVAMKLRVRHPGSKKIFREFHTTFQGIVGFA